MQWQDGISLLQNATGTCVNLSPHQHRYSDEILLIRELQTLLCDSMLQARLDALEQYPQADPTPFYSLLNNG